MYLWDLTFRVDHSHVLGTLQFETQDRHAKVQVEAQVWMDSWSSIDPVTQAFTSYQVLLGLDISDHAVSNYMQLINRVLRYVRLSTSLIYILPNHQAEN